MKREKKTWELKDVIMMAILGVVFAAVYMAVFQGGLALSTALTPLGLSSFGFEIIYGVWFMAATLAAYIIRKPGVALITEVLASAIELLMGNSGGLTVVLTGIIQGAGAELVFALFRYRKWNLGTLCLGGMLSALFIFCYELYYLNYIALAPGLLIGQLAVRFVSAALFSGVIVKLAGDGLAKTGVVKSYAIGAKADIGKVYDDEEGMIMEKLKVVLDWFPNTNHTGYLLAEKRGWFRDAGLDVEISGEVHGAMHLHGADFICGPEISMLDCMERGEDMTCVAVMTQKCDSGIVSLKEAGITRPRELEGKRLTHWSPAWFHKAIGRVVEVDGGDYSKVKLLNMDVGDIVATLGDVADATWVYENWENQVLLEAGKEINYFNLGDIDPIFDFCAPAMAAAKATLEQKPEAVRAFLAVLDRAYREVAANPEATVLEVRDRMPEGSSDALLIRSQKHLAPILLDSQGRWGRIRPERWDRMADYMLSVGVISRRRDNEYTNDYFAQ